MLDEAKFIGFHGAINDLLNVFAHLIDVLVIHKEQFQDIMDRGRLSPQERDRLQFSLDEKRSNWIGQNKKEFRSIEFIQICSMLEKQVDISNLLPCRQLTKNFTDMAIKLQKFRDDLENDVEDFVEDVELFLIYDREKIKFMMENILLTFIQHTNHDNGVKYLETLINYCRKNVTMAKQIISNLTKILTEDKEMLFKILFPKYSEVTLVMKIYKLFVSDLMSILYVLASCDGVQKDKPMNITHECKY